MKRLRVNRGFLGICFALVLASCDDSYAPPPAALTALVTFFNASSYSQLNVEVNGSLIGRDMNFGDLTGYNTITTAVSANTVKLTAPGLTAERSLNLNDDAYTAFLIDNGSSVDVMSVSDRSDKPVAGSMMIRFINLSPDAPAVNFFLGKEQMTTAQAFKQSTEFKERFGSIYDIEVRSAEDDTVLLTAEDVTMPDGDYYTIALVGNVTTSSDRPNPLTLQLINP